MRKLLLVTPSKITEIHNTKGYRKFDENQVGYRCWPMDFIGIHRIPMKSIRSTRSPVVKYSIRPQLRQVQEMWNMPRFLSHEAKLLISSEEHLKYISFSKPWCETALNTDKYSVREICLVFEAIKRDNPLLGRITSNVFSSFRAMTTACYKRTM